LKEEQRTNLLKAQVLYKLGEYQSAVDLYAALLSKVSEDDVPDLLTNLVACSANDSTLFQQVEGIARKASVSDI